MVALPHSTNAQATWFHCYSGAHFNLINIQCPAKFTVNQLILWNKDHSRNNWTASAIYTHFRSFLIYLNPSKGQPWGNTNRSKDMLTFRETSHFFFNVFWFTQTLPTCLRKARNNLLLVQEYISETLLQWHWMASCSTETLEWRNIAKNLKPQSVNSAHGNWHSDM